jgi:hypothetical protein
VYFGQESVLYVAARFAVRDTEVLTLVLHSPPDDGLKMIFSASVMGSKKLSKMCSKEVTVLLSYFILLRGSQ